ncbi:MAG: hypothetical protein ACRDJN_13385 [Chloroflexota bacterium]
MGMRTRLLVAGLILAAVLPALPARAALAQAPPGRPLPSGAVVALAATPHLWVADAQGVLHWAGDTRALAGRAPNWDDRSERTLDELVALPRGEPWLSAGLLKDGEPIYLVKWETDETVPTLLHIQCLTDLELFGITGENYGTFVLDAATWERRYGIAVAGLVRAELSQATCSPSGSSGETPSVGQPGAPSGPSGAGSSGGSSGSGVSGGGGSTGSVGAAGSNGGVSGGGSDPSPTPVDDSPSGGPADPVNQAPADSTDPSTGSGTAQGDGPILGETNQLAPGGQAAPGGPTTALDEAYRLLGDSPPSLGGGPSVPSVPMGQTPELGSLALFGSGAAGLAGYLMTRSRARRRPRE